MESAMVKTATHARFNEGMNDLANQAPPNVRILCQQNNKGSFIPDEMDLPPLELTVSDDPFDRLDELTPAIICDHPTLGFEVSECHIQKRAYISNIFPHTFARLIKNARRRYIGSFVVSVNNTPIFTAESAISTLSTVASYDDTSFRIVFAPDRYIPVADRRLDSPINLSVNQLRMISLILSEPVSEESLLCTTDHDSMEPGNCPGLIMRSLDTTSHGTPE